MFCKIFSHNNSTIKTRCILSRGLLRIVLPSNSSGCGFSLNLKRGLKIYAEHENQYAHQVLVESLKSYQLFQQNDVPTHYSDAKIVPISAYVFNGTIPLKTNISDCYADFCALIEHCLRTNTSFEEANFKKFVEHYIQISYRFTDEQLLGTLQQLSRLQPVSSSKAENFMQLWNALDIECCRRIEQWSSEYLLLICDAWYVLGLARIGEFVWQALRKLGRKVRCMPPEQLVQSMFLCNVVRRPIFEMFDYEANLVKCVELLTLQELGVMAMGFFKTQTAIRNPHLLEQLYKRLQAELNTVEDITLVSLLKILRYSSRLQQADLMMSLLDGLCSQVHRLSLVGCLHIALLGSELQACHDSVLELILQRFDKDLHLARLKDLERICLVIALFNYNSISRVAHRICERIPDILKEPARMTELLKYPRCFTNCLHFLTLRGIYDVDMFDAIFDRRFTKLAYKTELLGREYFHLDTFIKVNLLACDYQGKQLTNKQRQLMGKLYTQYIPKRCEKYKLHSTDRILLEIKETAETILRALSLKHVLPNYERSDLIICYDRKQNRAVPLATTCADDYSGVILTREELLGDRLASHIDTIILVVAGWNNVVRDTDRYTGLFDMKLKQLEMLGHKPIVIYWQKWRELENSKDRQNYLKRCLSAVINL